MESDADRLAMIEALGGIGVTVPTGTLTAIYDRAYQGALSDPNVEGAVPALTCRTSDVERLGIAKGQPVDVAGEPYRVARHEPDGTGMSTLVLKR